MLKVINGTFFLSSDGSATSTNGVSERRQSMPPRMQESASSRPKRYSSMRPRNVPETSTAPPPPVSASYTPPAPHQFYQPGKIKSPRPNNVNVSVALPSLECSFASLPWSLQNFMVIQDGTLLPFLLPAITSIPQ